MENLITICIVNFNSADFIINNLYCLQKLTKNKIKIVIRDNNSKNKDFKKLEKHIKDYLNVELYRIEDFDFKGSMAHGIAVNDLLEKIDTKYGLILDADCTFLYKNWDEILINELNEKYPIIGTQLTEGGSSKKSKNFPLAYAILFNTKVLKELEVDFIPKNVENSEDVGYNLEHKFVEKGYYGKIIKAKNTRTFKLGPFRNLLCTEYYLDGINEIFACHFGRGSTLGAAKYYRGRKKFIYLIPFFGKLLLKSKGKKERKKWIQICKNIVNNIN